jgi:peptidoglycan-N-acetylglucosamine deacetylase
MRLGLTAVLVLISMPLSAALSPGEFYSDGPKTQKAIALTFDDGPGLYTQKVLDLLKKYNVKATFFMNGDQVLIRPALAVAVRDGGHEIGDHTWSHMNFFAYEKKQGTPAARTKITEEIKRSLAEIKKVTGVESKILRMPHGYHRPWMKEVALDQKVALVNWTFGQDWLNIGAEKMAADYEKYVRPGAILLFHDGGKNREKTLIAAERVIQKAQKEGYQILPVGQLLCLP